MQSTLCLDRCIRFLKLHGRFREAQYGAESFTKTFTNNADVLNALTLISIT